MKYSLYTTNPSFLQVVNSNMNRCPIDRRDSMPEEFCKMAVVVYGYVLSKLYDHTFVFATKAQMKHRKNKSPLTNFVFIKLSANVHAQNRVY